MGASVKPKAKRGRPLKPLITKEAAVEAAIVLVEREGIDSLSVQGVARTIGVTAPSLYYHFKDKDELLQLVARALLREVGAEGGDATGWKERAIALAVATRRTILRHPNAAPLMLRYFPGRTEGVDFDPIPEEHLRGTSYVAIEVTDASAKVRRGGPKGPRDQDPTAPGTAGVLVFDPPR